MPTIIGTLPDVLGMWAKEQLEDVLSRESVTIQLTVVETGHTATAILFPKSRRSPGLGKADLEFIERDTE